MKRIYRKPMPPQCHFKLPVGNSRYRILRMREGLREDQLGLQIQSQPTPSNILFGRVDVAQNRRTVGRDILVLTARPSWCPEVNFACLMTRLIASASPVNALLSCRLTHISIFVYDELKLSNSTTLSSIALFFCERVELYPQSLQ